MFYVLPTTVTSSVDLVVSPFMRPSHRLLVNDPTQLFLVFHTCLANIHDVALACSVWLDSVAQTATESIHSVISTKLLICVNLKIYCLF